jgi:hypothetical protein
VLRDALAEGTAISWKAEGGGAHTHALDARQETIHGVHRIWFKTDHMFTYIIRQITLSNIFSSTAVALLAVASLHSARRGGCTN